MIQTKNRLGALLITVLFFSTTTLFSAPIHPFYTSRENFTNEAALRTIAIIAYDGNNVELNDGSIWNIRSWSNQEELASWNTSDPVVFSKESWPNYYGGAYKITNLSNQRCVYADLSQNAYTNDSCSYSVYAITSRNTVILKTGNHRLVLFEARNASTEHRFMQRWSIGDTILVGRNYFPSLNTKHTHILINYKANEYNEEFIQARYLGYIQN
jgi:hypothetical protein